MRVLGGPDDMRPRLARAVVRRMPARRLDIFTGKHPPPDVTVHPPSAGHSRWRAFITEGTVPGDGRAMVITDYDLAAFVGRLEKLFAAAGPRARPG